MLRRAGHRTALAAALSTSISACAPLPDLSGYGAATVQVRQSVALTGDAVGDELNRAAAAAGPGSAEMAAASARQFPESWAKTVASLDAMVAYANSLEAIAQAGNKGGESARAVAAQVERLASSVGVVPAAPVVGTVVSTAAFLYGELAKIRAARSLEAAVAASSPAIAAIEDLVAKQVGSARNVLRTSLSFQQAELTASPLGEAFAQRADVRQQQAAIVAQLSGSPPRAAELRTRLAVLEEMHAAVTPAAEEFEREKARLDARTAAGRELIVATQLALASWSDAHAEIVEAIRNRRPVTLDSLLAAVAEVRTLVRQWESV